MRNKFLIASFVILILVLFIWLIISKKNTIKIESIDSSKLNSRISELQEGLVYIPNDSEDSDLIEYFTTTYKLKILKAKLSLQEVSNIIKDASLDIDAKVPIIFVFDDGKIIGGFDADLEEEEADEMFRYYFFNELPQSMIKYKTLSTADEYIKKVNSKEYTVAIFGSSTCSYCNLYKPVFNNVAREYDVDIYYFDSEEYPADEYNNILKLDLEIPGECTLDGENTSLNESFPKPMTIITKSGNLVGCIRGYVTEDVLVNKLKEFKLIGGK